MNQPPTQLEDASGARSTPPIALFWLSIALSAIVAGGGLLCIFGYWMTEYFVFVSAGFLWLAIGGAGAVAALVLGSVYANAAERATPTIPEAVRRGNRAWLLALLNIPLAVICVMAGAYLVTNPRTTFAIHNVGTTPVARGEIEVGRMTVRFGAVPPGATQRVRLRAGDGGEVAIRIFDVSGTPVRFLLDEDADSDDLGKATVVIEVDGHNEPKVRW